MLLLLLTFLLTSDIDIACNNKQLSAFTGNRENQTRKRANSDNKGGVRNGNQFRTLRPCVRPSDRLMMMRHEGHTPYSRLPAVLRLSHFTSHATNKHTLWQ